MNIVEKSLKSLTKGALVILVGTFASKFLTYVYRLIIARIGTKEYGVVSLALAIAGFLTMISLFGLDIGVFRYVSYYLGKKDFKKIKQTLIFSSKFNLFLSLTLSFLLFILSDPIAVHIFKTKQLGIILKIISFMIPFDTLRTVFLRVIRGFKLVKYEVYSQHIGESITKILFTILFIYMGLNVYGAALAYVLSIFFSFLLVIFFFHQKISSFISIKLTSNEGIGRELLLYSWPLLLTGLLSMFLSWTDTLMIGFFRDAASVGVYNSALPTAHLTTALSKSMVVVFLPVISLLYVKRKLSEFENVFNTMFRWILAITILPTLLFVIFPKQILYIFFGESYAAGKAALAILSICFFISNFSDMPRDILLLVKKTKTIFFVNFIGVILNIILNVILIPIYGINGAAFSTGFSFVLITLLYYLLIYKEMPIKMLPIINCCKIFFSAAIVGFIVYLIKLKLNIGKNLLLLISIGVFSLLFYLFMLYITNSINPDDKKIIKAILKYILRLKREKFAKFKN